MRRADIYGAAGLLALGLLVLFVIIPAEAGGGTWSGISPLFFPTVIAAGFTLAAAALLIRAMLSPASYEGTEAPGNWRHIGFFLVSCAIIFAAVLAIHIFGILWGGPILVGALMLFMGEHDWRRIVPISVLPVVVIYVFVTKVLNAPLP